MSGYFRYVSFHQFENIKLRRGIDLKWSWHWHFFSNEADILRMKLTLTFLRMASTLSLLLLSVVIGGKLGGATEERHNAEINFFPLKAKSSRNQEVKDTGTKNDMFQLSRGGRVFSDSQTKANSFSRPSLAAPYPSSPSPPSTPRPSPFESLSSLVSQGFGVFGSSTPTISLPGLTSSLAGILSQGLGLAQTFPHAGGLSRVDSLVSNEAVFQNLY